MHEAPSPFVCVCVHGRYVVMRRLAYLRFSSSGPARRLAVWSHSAASRLAVAATAAFVAPAACEEKRPRHPPGYPLWIKSIFHAHGIPKVRRGYEVYRQVRATCPSTKQLHSRHSVNAVYPEKLMTEFASTFDVVDGPNDEGEMFTRPGILVDAFPSPYPNEEPARSANGGALPPDLSARTTAKHEGLDYIFALLLGYLDPPTGIAMRDGLYYNPYDPGGIIAMPPPTRTGWWTTRQHALHEVADGETCG